METQPAKAHTEEMRVRVISTGGSSWRVEFESTLFAPVALPDFIYTIKYVRHHAFLYIAEVWATSARDAVTAVVNAFPGCKVTFISMGCISRDECVPGREIQGMYVNDPTRRRSIWARLGAFLGGRQ